MEKNIDRMEMMYYSIYELNKTNFGKLWMVTVSEKENRKMNLLDADPGKEYIVKDVLTEDEELNAFLFSLGCYQGEPITVISHLKGGCVVSIKDGRYNMDTDLAKAISI